MRLVGKGILTESIGVINKGNEIFVYRNPKNSKTHYSFAVWEDSFKLPIAKSKFKFTEKI